MEIPTYVKAKAAKEPNPLEGFVYEHEPAGHNDETKFRTELARMVDWVLSEKNTETEKLQAENLTLKNVGITQLEEIERLQAELDEFRGTDV